MPAIGSCSTVLFAVMAAVISASFTVVVLTLAMFAA